MDIAKHIGINDNTEYTTEEFNNILSKFNNLNMKDYYINSEFADLLSRQSVSTITKFINMFRDVDEFELELEHVSYTHRHSLAGNIIYIIMCKATCEKIYVYKIMDYLFKQGMDAAAVCIKRAKDITYDIIYFCDCYVFINKENHYYVTYMANNYDVIQNVRKLINNYDILLFDITNDLQFIELILLISKSKHKNLPKFVITHKILCYYLFYENITYNKR